jgi:uncharacterized protein (DUF111 family)
VKRALFGLAKSEDQASSIVNQLKGAGFSDNDISVLLRDSVGTRHVAHEQHTKALEGAAVGGASGVVLGGAFGWLVGIGTLAIPGFGPLVAAGPIIGALAGAGSGSVVGGVTGAAIGKGIPEFEAIQYEGKMDGGNILISVLTGNATERDHAKEIFKNAGSVTAAEAVVDHAYGKPSGAVGVAMSPIPAIQPVRDSRLPEPVGPAAQ